ncbi:MAG: right-handed parallel beta-helix repeat-containing protein [Candidatus Thorarchaeota archaeon]
MKRKSIPLMIIIVLCLQSFLVASLISQNGVEETKSPSIEKQMLPSQGSRLSPAEYTPHDTFLIDELTDFALFGFPGEGIESNPFVISSLNITASNGNISLKVLSIYAYITIVDCFINQGSSEYAIELVNTTHVTIEYVTIESAGGGINSFFANNTQIDYSHVSADVDAVLIDHSHGCQLNGNYFDGGTVSCNVMGALSFVSENNLYHASGVASPVILHYAYDSRSISDHINTSLVPYFIEHCPNFTISEAVIIGAFGGIYIEDSDSPIINQCSIFTENENGINVTRCPNVIVRDNTITSPLGIGINVGESNYTQIIGNSVSQADSSGIIVSNSIQAFASQNIIYQGIGGISFDHCENSLITYNDISGCWFGIGMGFCNNSAMTFNTLYNLEMGGMGGNNNFNISITDNIIDTTGRGGITLGMEEHGFGAEICRNQITNITWYAIQVNEYTDVVVSDNSINHLYGDTPALWWDEGMGVRISECNDVEIEGNYVTDATTGIGTASCVNLTVDSNVIDDIVLLGIGDVNSANANFTNNQVSNCDQVGISRGMFVAPNQPYVGLPSAYISGNTLSGCGFALNFDSIFQFEVQHLSENIVNSMPILYAFNESSLDIDGDTYSQIIIVNCTNLNVTNHDVIYDNTITYIDFSANIRINGIKAGSIYNNLEIGNSQFITIENFISNYNDIYSGFEGWFHPHSVFVKNSYFIMIKDSILEGNNENVGIEFEDSHNVTVSDCDIRDMYSGILIRSLSDSTFLRNSISKTQYGIYGPPVSSTGYNVSIIDNEIRHCYVDGIFIGNDDFDSGLIQGNTIESSGNGIHIANGDYWTIQNNTIRWNEDYGIYLLSSTGTNVTYNILGFNGIENGYDTLAQNWDDDISLGNFWYDYSPPGVYPISGGAGAQDRYPQQYNLTEPIINQPLDVQYAEGTTNHTIIWTPVDDALDDWFVTIDGAYWAADSWNSDNITVNIDGLDYGTHTLVITIRDISLNTVTDEVIIQVYDDTTPIINHLPDGEAFVYGEGQVLTWEVSDAHPDEYNLFVDDKLAELGSWSSGLLEVNIDGQGEGERQIEIRIYDLDGNVAIDSILVLFIGDDVAPIIDSPDDIIIGYNSVGRNITWTPQDEFPGNYSITMNGTAIVSENWNDSTIVLSLDSLEVGVYDFEVTVVDRAGQSASDVVRVTVQGATDGGLFTTDLVLIVGGIAGVIVVLSIIVLIRKRKAG